MTNFLFYSCFVLANHLNLCVVHYFFHFILFRILYSLYFEILYAFYTHHILRSYMVLRFICILYSSLFEILYGIIANRLTPIIMIYAFWMLEDFVYRITEHFDGTNELLYDAINLFFLSSSYFLNTFPAVEMVLW